MGCVGVVSQRGQSITGSRSVSATSIGTALRVNLFGVPGFSGQANGLKVAHMKYAYAGDGGASCTPAMVPPVAMTSTFGSAADCEVGCGRAGVGDGATAAGLLLAVGAGVAAVGEGVLAAVHAAVASRPTVSPPSAKLRLTVLINFRFIGLKG